MAEINFSIDNHGVVKFRLEPTEIRGSSKAAVPTLTLLFKMQLTPLPGQSPVHYTLVRLAGRIVIAQPNEEDIAVFEAPPLAEKSTINVFERPFEVDVPVGLRAAKRIEDLRDGKNPCFRVWLNGLVFVQGQRFEQLTNSVMDITIPRSHWIDHVLSTWKVSDLRLLEISTPSAMIPELAAARERLARAEQEYRVGNYSQVLVSLRLAFEAVADAYGVNRADKNLFDKMLKGCHPDIGAKLRDSFGAIYSLLNAGPHEPVSTGSNAPPIGREEARFALVATYAIFEYFARNGWPAI